MRNCYSVALSLVAGAAFGAAAVQTLHAEAKPPAYVVSEADVMDVASFDKDYMPAADKAITAAGGTFIARNGRAESIYGVPPRRIAIIRFDSLAEAEAAFTTEAYRHAQDVGGRTADFRIYAVEGMPAP